MSDTLNRLYWKFLQVINIFLVVLIWVVMASVAWGSGSSSKHGYVFDQRYHHNKYYLRRGAKVNVLPKGYRLVHHHGGRYFFHGGNWYRPLGPEFLVTSPPIGLLTPFLPPVYTTIWVGGIPYYYADHTYYRWIPEKKAYVVGKPPPESEVVEEYKIPNKIFAYPKQDQSEKQQATDRYECHVWAKGQSGFDPTQPGGGVAVTESASKRRSYNRAIKACLEARGYSTE